MFVYAISDGHGAHKIGSAENVAARLIELQVGNHRRLSVSFSLPSEHAARIERRVHWALASRHVSGEWFDVTTEEARQATDLALAEEAAGAPLPPKRFDTRGAETKERARRPRGSPKLTPILVRMPDDLIAQIDAARGDVPRAVFIRRCCERAVTPQSVTPDEVRASMRLPKPREPDSVAPNNLANFSSRHHFADTVQVGPVAPRPGDRLKKPKGPKK